MTASRWRPPRTFNVSGVRRLDRSTLPLVNVGQRPRGGLGQDGQRHADADRLEHLHRRHDHHRRHCRPGHATTAATRTPLPWVPGRSRSAQRPNHLWRDRGRTVVTTTIANNFSVNGGVFFGQDGYQNLTGTVTIGPGGLTAYTQWGNKDLALAQLAGSGPLVIDSAIAAVSTQALQAESCMSAAVPATRERSRSMRPVSSLAGIRHGPWRRAGGRLGRPPWPMRRWS